MANKYGFYVAPWGSAITHSDQSHFEDSTYLTYIELQKQHLNNAKDR